MEQCSTVACLFNSEFFFRNGLEFLTTTMVPESDPNSLSGCNPALRKSPGFQGGISGRGVASSDLLVVSSKPTIILSETLEASSTPPAIALFHNRVQLSTPFE